MTEDDKDGGNVPVIDHEARTQAGLALRTAERAELKAEGLKDRLDKIDEDIKTGFRDQRDAVIRVHQRIDEILETVNQETTAIRGRITAIALGVAGTLAVIVLQIVASKLGLL